MCGKTHLLSSDSLLLPGLMTLWLSENIHVICYNIFCLYTVMTLYFPTTLEFFRTLSKHLLVII